MDQERTGYRAKDAPHAPHRDRKPDPQGAALLMIDLINGFDFEGGEALHEKSLRICDPLLTLRAELETADCPVIYVNDNFGEWHSERSHLVRRAVSAGSEVARRLAPGDRDFFIIKPQFSGFYATNLPVLLPKLGIRRLILSGAATEICVFFTAADAHMRDYSLWVPSDLVAAQDDQNGQAALSIMQNAMGAEIAPTSELHFADWMKRLDAGLSG